MNPSDEHVAVIGAGIIGTCCASVLRRRGFAVTLIDSVPPCAGTSRGNAGAIATAEIMPLASPGILMKAPLWLLDPLGPLAIKPAHLPRLVPWLYRFWRAGSLTQVRRSATAIASLMDLTVPAWQRMASAANVTHKLRTLGEIHVYEGKRRFDAAQWAWSMRRDLGLHFDALSREDIAGLEPSLSETFTHGFHVPDWIQVTDPFELGTDIADHALDQGVSLLSGIVVGIQDNNGATTLMLDNGTSLSCDQAILAGGAWSHHLPRQWGEVFPLEAERGYNTTFPTPAINIQRQITFADHGFVVSPLSSGLRVGGAVELAGLQAPPNFKRAKDMVSKARRFLPALEALKSGGGTEWMGYRPSLPDSLPVIGRSEKRPALLYAFGHGHLGLTLAGVTAELVADLACGRPAPIDISPFSPKRF